jgi:hypothetical protein
VAQERADILAEHFEATHGLTTPQKITRHAEAVEKLVSKASQRMEKMIDVQRTITQTDVQKQIRKLKRRTAPGEDGISNTMIRNFTPNTIRHLTVIFNAVLQLGYFPTRWKHANILAIPKPTKSPQEPGSYRPISLLPALSILMERMVEKRIERYARQKRIIPDEQFGFRKGHSTTAQLARITDDITHGYNVNKHTGLVLLDIEKAYDTIWVSGLIYKLINLGFPEYITLFLMSYLTQRTFSVTVSGYHSTPKHITAGLPQGAVLSPILFTIYSKYLHVNASRSECRTKSQHKDR